MTGKPTSKHRQAAMPHDAPGKQPLLALGCARWVDAGTQVKGSRVKVPQPVYLRLNIANRPSLYISLYKVFSHQSNKQIKLR